MKNSKFLMILGVALAIAFAFSCDSNGGGGDTTAPKVKSVTPGGAGAAVSGNVVVTFSEAMNTKAGTVKLNTTELSGGAWSAKKNVLTLPYSGLALDTGYTVHIAGFKDAAGNVMTADSSHSFTTVGDPPLAGNIAVNPAGAFVGTALKASYTGGTETVTYQWKKGGVNVGTGDSYTPDTAGSYTVTVSAEGFASKTSAAVIVTKWEDAETNDAFPPGSPSFFIFDVAYGKNTFVAVGSQGRIAYSKDGGLTWAPVPDSTFGDSAEWFDWINGVAYGAGKFIALGSDGNIAYSSDGVTWTAVTNLFGDHPWAEGQLRVYAAAYGNGKFVAVGDMSIAYSTDGISWTRVPRGADDGTTATFGDVTVDEGGYIQDVGVPTVVTDVAYGNGTFVAVAQQGRMAYSSNGERWYAVEDSAVGGNNFNGIAFGNGRFVAVCDGGGEQTAKIAYSTDGIHWTAAADSTFVTDYGSSPVIYDVAYGDGRFVAVGYDTGARMAWSVDGVSWQSTAMFGDFGGIYGITFAGNGKFVAVGGTIDEYGESLPRIAVSVVE